jgi:acylglycerol lipase
VRHESGRFTGRGGVRLFHQSWLPPDAPRATLVNLHGLGDHGGLYATLVERMVGEGIAVHAFDLRGHGRSSGQRAYLSDWRDYREDLDSFVQLVAPEGTRRPFLLGNSLGGLIALEYAALHGERLAGVIAASPPVGALAVPPLLMALGRVMSRLWPRFSLTTGLDLSGLSRDPAAAAEVLKDPLFHRKGTARLSTEVTAAIARMRDLAPAIRLPVLLLHGSADRIVPPEGTRELFARLTVDDRTLIEYEGGYHALFADLEAEAVLGDVIGWIRRHLP